MEWLLFVLGAAAVGGSLYLGYRERRDFAKLQEQAGRVRPGELEEISLVVADLQQELTRTAERISGELEERAAALQQLISEARSVTAMVEAAGVKEAAAQQAADDEVQPQVESEKEAEPSAAGAPQDPAAGSAVEPVGAKGWRTVETRVWELFETGLAVDEIARRLEVGKGEVKLILDLKKAQAR